MSDERRERVVKGVRESGTAFSAVHPIHRLTRSERKVLSLVAQGKRNKDIADQLFVSVNTVKTHLQHIFKKLEVSSRIEASQAYRSLMRRLI